MPLDLRLGPVDIAGIRFARSPMWETMEALRTVLEPPRHAYHLSWLRAVDVRAAEAELGATGRVLLRPSGTEPLVRVMVEAPTIEQAEATAARLAQVVAAAG